MLHQIRPLIVPISLFGSLLGFVNDVLIVNEIASKTLLFLVATTMVFFLITYLGAMRFNRSPQLIQNLKFGFQFFAFSSLVVFIFFVISLSYKDRGGIIASNSDSVTQFQSALLAQNETIIEKQEVLIEKVANTKQETSSDPRKELFNIGVDFSAASLQKALREGDARVLELFVQSGIPHDMASKALIDDAFLLDLIMAAFAGNDVGASIQTISKGDIDVSHDPRATDTMNRLDRYIYMKYILRRPEPTIQYCGDARNDLHCKKSNAETTHKLLKSLKSIGLQLKCWNDVNDLSFSELREDPRYNRRFDERTKKANQLALQRGEALIEGNKQYFASQICLMMRNFAI